MAIEVGKIEDAKCPDCGGTVTEAVFEKTVRINNEILYLYRCKCSNLHRFVVYTHLKCH